MEVRLGQLLVEQGVLTPGQADHVLRIQQETGEPFGLLCERLYEVDPAVIEEAWAVQYASLCQHVDPLTEPVEEQALDMVSRRQAWQFRILPMRFDHGELIMATTPKHLRRALRFATNVIGVPVYLVLASPDRLGEALSRYYSLPGMSVGLVDGEEIDGVLRRPHVTPQTGQHV